MFPCKFQTDASGEAVLIYSEDQDTIYAIAENENAKAIRSALSLPERLGKAFAMADIDESGQIIIGEKLPEQFW